MTVAEHAPPPAIEASGITVRYGDRWALDGFGIVIPRGGVFGLLGPNGSGKSTFLTLVAAMEAPGEGELRVLGQAPSRELRARSGVVFQEPTLDPTMTPEETLRFAGRLFGARNVDARGLLERFGLGERVGDSIATLSGGMRRRLEVARALVHDPELLLLDEPTTGIDPGERRAMWEMLLRGSGERTVLLATNDLAEADSVCDRVAFLDRGRVVTVGAPEELRRDLRREALRVRWPAIPDGAAATIAGWPGVGDVAFDGEWLHVAADAAAPVIGRLFEAFAGQVSDVHVGVSTLEDAYFHHVGTHPAQRAAEAVR